MTTAPQYDRPALVTGGDHQGLAAVRCLARHGVSVYVCDHEHSIARYSRFCKGYFRAPPPREVERYVEFLLQLGRRPELSGAVLIPDSDEQVYAMATHRDELAKCFTVSVPPWTVIEPVYVKSSTYARAARLGIPAPRTLQAQDAGEARKLVDQYPVILKPSIRDHYYRETKTKALLVSGPTEMESRFREMQRVIPPAEILIQELVPGGASRLYSAGVFFKNGRVRAGIVGRRSRQHPMDFGHATTFAEMVDLPELICRAERFLAEIDYYGIAEVEFLHDTRDNEYKLIEINPRIWGWHLLAIANGVKLPLYEYQDLIGQDMEVPVVSSPPIKWVRLITDLPTFVREWYGGRMKWSNWIASLRRPLQFSVWAADDPLPCLMESLLLPYIYWKRGF